ncbi:hypothetical protein MUK42_37592, partial [Musa troglodytarum]
TLRRKRRRGGSVALRKEREREKSKQKLCFLSRFCSMKTRGDGGDGEEAADGAREESWHSRSRPR